MMPDHLILDIETIPDPELPAVEDPDKVSAPPFHQIVTVGCLLLENYVPKKIGIVGEGKGEAAALHDLATWLDRARPTVITWNGRSFDMPVITSRALKRGVAMPWWFSDRNTRYRFSPDGHLDLMDFLADFGAARCGRLDVFAKLVGFPGKTGVDGSQVSAMVQAGRLDEVNAYCLCDVVQTAAIFLRVQLLRGLIDRARYQELGRSLLAFIDADARLAPVAAKVDRTRFLLEEIK
jgi:predicted PolB exonuclease-like 3'-5' exonuclease